MKRLPSSALVILRLWWLFWGNHEWMNWEWDFLSGSFYGTKLTFIEIIPPQIWGKRDAGRWLGAEAQESCPAACQGVSEGSMGEGTISNHYRCTRCTYLQPHVHPCFPRFWLASLPLARRPLQGPQTLPMLIRQLWKNGTVGRFHFVLSLWLFTFLYFSFLRFKQFNALFDEVHIRQVSWTIPDLELRSAVQLQVAEVLVPAYRSFLRRYRWAQNSPLFWSTSWSPGHFSGSLILFFSRSILEQGSTFGKTPNPQKYIKYNPDDLDSLLGELFEGKQKTQHGKA